MTELFENLRETSRQLFRTGNVHHMTAHTLSKMLLASLKLHAVALLAQISGMISLVAMFWAEGPEHKLLLVWFFFGLVQIYCSLRFVQRFWQDRRKAENVRVWVRRWMILAVFSGVLWGVAGPLMMSTLSGLSQVVTVAVIVAVTFASWPVYSFWLPSLTAFTLLSLAPLTIAVAAQYGVSETFLALLMLAVTGFILYSGRKLNEMLAQSILNDNQNRRLVERLRQEISTAEAARRTAENDSARRARFFAAANHDIRQPLQAMGIYLDILKRQVPENVVPTVDQITQTAGDISTLVEQVLTVTRMEFGEVEYHPEELPLNSLMEELVAEVRPVAKKHGFRLRLVTGEPVRVECDRQMLVRAVKNILNNAINYSRPDAPVPEIVVGVRNVLEGRVTIGVYDCGPGLSADDRQKVFETFYRGSAGKTSKASGYGLGLSIVRGLARQMGATLSVGSRPGRGSVFRLSLACIRDEHRAARTGFEEPAAELPGLDGAVVLIEDDDRLRDAFASLLRGWGLEVIEGDSLDNDVVERADDARRSLVACLSDYNLGENRPTGVEVAETLNRELSLDLPLILLTAVHRDLIEAQMRRLGIHFNRPPTILQKPVDAETLNTTLVRLSRMKAAAEAMEPRPPVPPAGGTHPDGASV